MPTINERILNIVTHHEHALDDEDGPTPKHSYVGPRYLVLYTAFHDGGLVSRHRTLHGAARVVARMRAATTCTCGCVGIWDQEREGQPSAYAAQGEHYSQLCG